MGQYHLIVNLDKRQFLDPHKFGDGLKLMEFGQSGDGGTMTALAILLAVSSREGGRGGGDMHTDREAIVGSWGGDRIVVIGDYAEADDLPAEHQAETLYERCRDGELVDLSEVMRDLLRDGGEGRYFSTRWGGVTRVSPWGGEEKPEHAVEAL